MQKKSPTDIYSSINPVFDALVYLGNRADGTDMKVCYELLAKRRPFNKEEIAELMVPFFEFEKYMDNRIVVDNAVLERFFKRNEPDVNVFSVSGNIASMIFGLLVSRKRFETAREAADAVSKMDMIDRFSSLLTYVRKPYVIVKHVKTFEEFYQTLCELKVKSSLKWDCMDCYYNFSKYLSEITPILEATVDAIREWCDKGAVDIPRISDDYAENFLRQRIRKFGLNEEEIKDIPIYRSIAMPAHWEVEISIDDDNEENRITAITGYTGFLLQAMYGFQSSAISPECMVDAFKALGDSSRFGILSCLMERPMIGRELAKELGLAPNTISQHLSKLIAEDLVTRKLEGSYTCYSVNSTKISKIADDLKGYFCRSEETD